MFPCTPFGMQDVIPPLVFGPKPEQSRCPAGIAAAASSFGQTQRLHPATCEPERSLFVSVEKFIMKDEDRKCFSTARVRNRLATPPDPDEEEARKCCFNSLIESGR